MKVKIWSRNKNEKGGIACMPMKKNIPKGKEGWILTTCPKCGRECWETPLLRQVKEQVAATYCTDCAIREGTK